MENSYEKFNEKNEDYYVFKTIYETDNLKIRYVFFNDMKYFSLNDINKNLHINFRHSYDINNIYVEVLSRMGKRKTVFAKESICLKKILNSTKQKQIRMVLEEIKPYSKFEYKPRYEIEAKQYFFETFKGILKIEHQYQVQGENGKYRLDFYIPSLNLVIECDENNHCGYDSIADAIRTETINKILNNPQWIRYQPEFENPAEIANSILKIYLKSNSISIKN